MRKSLFALGCSIFSLVLLTIGGCAASSSGGGSIPPEQQAAAPTFSPAGGAYSAVQSVSLATATSGAAIYYTTDGSTPTDISTLFATGTPIAVSSNMTIKAIAAKAPGYTNSNVATATYTINLPAAATPTFSPAPGTYTSAQSVSVASSTAGASIYYTTDGSTPTSKSTKFSTSAPIAIAATTTIKAIAVAAGFANSAVATGAYTINAPTTVATPTFYPAPGAYTSPQGVRLYDATAGASIYYTIDGTAPTSQSTLYSTTAPIAVSSTTTIKAIAVASGLANSTVATGTYNLDASTTTATPTFLPAPGTYTTAQSVSLACATAGATIYYTTDGSGPTINSTVYSASAPIQISSTTTINAMAVATGKAISATATGTYTLNLPTTATPTFSPAPGIYTAAQSVSLASTTTGASIYYTTDGSTPTNQSTLFSAGTPIGVGITSTIKAIAESPGLVDSAVAIGAYSIIGSTASVTLSDEKGRRMETEEPINFNLGSTADIGTNTVFVDPTLKFQTMDGFGAEFTDSAAYLLEQVETPAAQDGTLNDLFTRTGGGIGLSFMSIPMGATDAARSLYSYDDQPVGTTDLSLANFSIAHDQQYILPLIKIAKTLNPQMKLFATPWSPPGWMKDPASMNPVSMLGGSLLMTPANETAFANYFVKFIQAYQSAGVPIDYISLQNNPYLGNVSFSPSMDMDAPTQLALLQGYVLPAFTANNIASKVFAYDGPWDVSAYPETVLGGLTTAQMSQVAGTAWHDVSTSPSTLQMLQDQYMTLGNWVTEDTIGSGSPDPFKAELLDITLTLRNSAKSIVKGSLALDQNFGPNLTQIGLAGCDCLPLVTVNSVTGAATKDIDYYTLGHYSRFVLPGAGRVYSNNTPGVASVAFQNPDGSMVLIAINGTTTVQAFQVQWGTESFQYRLAAPSIVTFTWSGSEAGSTPPVAATSQIQASSYSAAQGLEAIPTGDSSETYELFDIADGAYAVYPNVDFGAGVSQVNVNVENSGNAGTATFYLDSMTGTPIATVNLSLTGSEDAWETVNGTVTGATGVHTLYVVFGGAAPGYGGAVNWLQFQ